MESEKIDDYKFQMSEATRQLAQLMNYENISRVGPAEVIKSFLPFRNNKKRLWKNGKTK